MSITGRTCAAIVAMALLADACATAAAPPATTPDAKQTTGMPTATASATATASPIRIESVIGSDDITLVVTSPVSRGQAARATVTTNPNAFCSIAVSYAPRPAAADGLAPKDADGGGMVSWSWMVEPNVPPGSWPVEVTCATVSGLRAVGRQLIEIR